MTRLALAAKSLLLVLLLVTDGKLFISLLKPLRMPLESKLSRHTLLLVDHMIVACVGRFVPLLIGNLCLAGLLP